MKCQRCEKEMINFTCSLYTDELICYDCVDEEKSHPTYEEVKKLEYEAILNGNYNYCHGLPDDIRDKYLKNKGE